MDHTVVDQKQERTVRKSHIGGVQRRKFEENVAKYDFVAIVAKAHYGLLIGQL